MGRMLLLGRLVSRDLRHRPGEAAMLLLALMAATATLTLGLVLHGVTSDPYGQTRTATAGPDVIANGATNKKGETTPAALGQLQALTQAAGVAGHSGPFPATVALLRTGGTTAGAQVEGRELAPASVDQPKVTQGSWIRPGGAVLERSFADALGIRAGGSITLNGRSFKVVGIAVTAAFTPFPRICVRCFDFNLPQLSPSNTGLIWLAETDVKSLATKAEPLVYFVNLRLTHPGRVNTFISSHDGASSTSASLTSWLQLREQDGAAISQEQQALLAGSWLLALLAIASITVLVGGRMADQTRRVGLLKAVGGTPGLIAAVLLTEYLGLALIAAAVGLLAGWLAAPLLTRPGAGLIGTAGAPPFTLFTVGIVAATAVAMAVAAALVPAIHAARTSTVRALAGSVRPPRRRGWLTAISARLPVPLLLGLRIATRRPRQLALSLISLTVTVSGIVAVLCALSRSNASPVGQSLRLANPQTEQTDRVLLIITVMLVALAAVNVLFITRATLTDSRHTSALSRALGATARQVSIALSAAQVLPAMVGVVPGIPGGFGLYLAVEQGGNGSTPPLWSLIAVVLGSLVVVAGLTGVPARVSARKPPAEVLNS